MHHLLRSLVFAGIAAGLAITAQAKIERTVEKSFSVTGAGKLHIETQGGRIEVMPAKDSVVRVTARERIKASTEAEADDVLKKLALTFEQDGNDVRVISKYERQPAGFHFGSWPPVQVDVIVTVPADYATSLHTSGGDITIGDLNGKAELHTSGGGIKLGQMGGTVDAHTSGGPITLGGARGSVQLRTSGGNIAVGRVDGTADVATSGGAIKIDAAGGALKAHTSGGSIRANLAGALQQECSLSTSGGSVTVNVDKAAAFRLEASTSGGSVDAAGLALTTDKTNRDRSRVAGNVNGGGPLLKLHSSGGSIRVAAN